jgi:hypothetical protein
MGAGLSDETVAKKLIEAQVVATAETEAGGVNNLDPEPLRS